MKKFVTTTFMIVAFLTASVNLEGACVGTSDLNPAAFFGAADVDAGYQQALENCCKGSLIYWFDFDNNAGGVWLIGDDGENSSCAVD